MCPDNCRNVVFFVLLFKFLLCKLVGLASVDWSGLFLCSWVSDGTSVCPACFPASYLRYWWGFRFSRFFLGAFLSGPLYDFLRVRLFLQRGCQFTVSNTGHKKVQERAKHVSWRQLYVSSKHQHFTSPSSLPEASVSQNLQTLCFVICHLVIKRFLCHCSYLMQ